MARRKADSNAEDATATCSWKGCENDAEDRVALDAGSETCESCGTEITKRTIFAMCAEHREEYEEKGDVTHLLLHAVGEDQ